MLSYRLAALALAAAQIGAGASAEASDSCALRTVLACEGGGYRAMAGCTGLTAGFLAALGADEPSSTGGGLGPVLQGVDLVAANSGGSWYAVTTLYSAEVPEMIEQMAASPAEAATIYRTKWTLKTLANSRRLRSIIPAFNPAVCPGLVAAYNGVPFTDVIYDDFIAGPTSMPDTATLSTKPNNSWAEGKVLLLCSSLPTPGTAGDDGRAWVHFSQNSTGDINGSISYKARTSNGNATFPTWTPVKFSFRLGDGPDAAAPFPFCASEDCNDLFLEYIGFSGESGENYTATSPGLGEIFNTFLVEGAGSLLIADVVSASNSAGGSAIVSNPAGDGGGFPSDPYASAACVDLATWVDNDSFGNPFSAEDSEISEGLIQDIAATGLQGLVDGGWTDNTGVANSLGVLTSATGCTEPRDLSITAMLTGAEAPLYFLDLFAGAGIDLGPVCSSPTYSEVKEQMQTSAALLPPFNATYLTNISYGTVRCETAENVWYGVKGGFEVDIHFLWIVTSLGTAPPEGDFFAEGIMSGEIVMTMAYENETVRDLAAQVLLFPNTTEGTSSSAPADGTSSASTEAPADSASSTSAEEEPPSESTTDGDASSALGRLFPLLPLSFALGGVLMPFTA